MIHTDIRMGKDELIEDKYHIWTSRGGFWWTLYHDNSWQDENIGDF